MAVGLALSGCSQTQSAFAKIMDWMLGGPREVLVYLYLLRVHDTEVSLAACLQADTSHFGVGRPS